MSNDQSPPVRKVIPYRKGGRRQSPFASKAFEFSGTALDIAIQQREQEELKEKADTSVDGDLPEETPRQASPAPEVHVFQELAPAADEQKLATPDTNQALISHAALPPQRLEPAERRPIQRRALAPARSKSTLPATALASTELRTFITRWRPFLTDTQIGICTYVYNNSVAIGEEFCFTSTAKLMAEVSKTERQIKTVLNQLLEWHFLFKGETIINAPREKRGTYYKLNLDKS